MKNHSIYQLTRARELKETLMTTGERAWTWISTFAMSFQFSARFRLFPKRFLITSFRIIFLCGSMARGEIYRTELHDIEVALEKSTPATWIEVVKDRFATGQSDTRCLSTRLPMTLNRTAFSITRHASNVVFHWNLLIPRWNTFDYSHD